MLAEPGQRMLNDRRGIRGVTLIELMVTISLLAILLVFVGPSMGSWLRNTQIRNTAQAIQAGLQRARQEAVKRNEPIRFSLVSLADSAVMDNSCALSSSGVSWVVSVDDPAGQCSSVASETIAPMIVDKAAGGVGGKHVSVTARQADPSTEAATAVTFDGFGRVVNGEPIGVIDIDDLTPGGDYRALRLVIARGGSIRMCEPKVSAPTDPRHC